MLTFVAKVLSRHFRFLSFILENALFVKLSETSVVNFANVLRAAFMLKDPKSLERH